MYASEPPPGKSQKLLQTGFINVIGMPMVIAFELHENPGVSGEFCVGDSDFRPRAPGTGQRIN